MQEKHTATTRDAMKTMKPSNAPDSFEGSVKYFPSVVLNSNCQSSFGSEGKKFPCSFCGKKFSRKGNLTRHEKLHSGVRPFKCPECGKTFVTKGNWKVHLATHLKPSVWFCEFCGKTYARRGFLDKHVLKHMQKGESKQEVYVRKAAEQAEKFLKKLEKKDVSKIARSPCTYNVEVLRGEPSQSSSTPSNSTEEVNQQQLAPPQLSSLDNKNMRSLKTEEHDPTKNSSSSWFNLPVGSEEGQHGVGSEEEREMSDRESEHREDRPHFCASLRAPSFEDLNIHKNGDLKENGNLEDGFEFRHILPPLGFPIISVSNSDHTKATQVSMQQFFSMLNNEVPMWYGSAGFQ